MEEKEIQKILLEKLRERKIVRDLEDKLPYDVEIKIDEKINIPYKITLLPDYNPKLFARHYQQDILIYSETEIIEDENKDIWLYNTKNPNIILPYIVLELKVGDGGSSHDLMTYSKKALDIKNLFPFSRYFYVMEEKPAWKVSFYRSNFDEIHSLNSKKPDKWDIDNLVKKIKKQFSKIKEHIIDMKKD